MRNDRVFDGHGNFLAVDDSDRLRQRGKLICALAPPRMESHLHMGIAVLLGPVSHPRRIAGLAFLLLEGEDHRHEGLAAGLGHPAAGVGVREHQLLVRYDFQVDARARDLLAVRHPHHDEVGAADPQINLCDGCGDRGGRKPLFQQGGSVQQRNSLSRGSTPYFATTTRTWFGPGRKRQMMWSWVVWRWCASAWRQ